ncbi:MAG: chromate transporter [Eubacteriales bacterium]|jgi:chromate transporter|nr:chromate transporter [Eubacteriales bacterium]
MKSKLKSLATLYVTFLKIGAFMFGGGYSMLPLLSRELVVRHGWITEETLLDYFAIAQCMPGAIAINTATLVGNQRDGVLGGAAALLGVITIPMALIVAVAASLMQFWHLPLVASAFAGIRVAVAALITAALINLIRTNVKNVLGIVLCVFAFIVVAVFGQSPILVVLAAAVTGLVAGRVKR